MASTNDRRGSADSARGEGPGRVIHVAFGAGGGRIPACSPEVAVDVERADAKRDEHNRNEGEPLTDVFTRREVARLLQVSESRLRWLDQQHIVSPSATKRARRVYTFQDLIALRATRELLAKEVRPRDVARAIGALRYTLPRVTRPLHELRIVSDGRKIVVRTSDGAFEPVTGQMLLDFEVASLKDDVLRVLRPAISPDRRQTAYDYYLEASALDEVPETFPQALELYESAVQIDPTLAIVYTNMGNIRFRQGNFDLAHELYRKALQYDEGQPEAHYNIGYMMFDRQDYPSAIRFFDSALERDPRFSDAHFNLALACERSGDRNRARVHWKHYLDLEPTGAWADVARSHL
jgi:tetratricopeptide (TPR) repeat protein